MKQMRVILFLLVISQAAFAEYSIHVMSPWKDDTNTVRKNKLSMEGNAEVDYFTGTPMVSEGGGWFFYNYKTETKSGTSTFKVFTKIGPEDWRGRVEYGQAISISKIFSQVPAGTEDVWIVLNRDTTKFPTVYTIPPNAKIINLFNPWPENSPKIIINGGVPIQMRNNEGLCGWYRYYYAGPPDSLKSISFTDYYATKKYTSAGMATGSGIDLRDKLTNQDTVYILPKPFPAGKPDLKNVFPGRLGECNTRNVSGIFRDWKYDNENFINQPIGSTSGGKGMVMPTLNAPDYKPKVNPASTKIGVTKLETWFTTITLPEGKDNDTCIDLTMTKGYDGRWTFDSDNTGGFFPLDNFVSSNNVKYLDNIDPKVASAKMRNFHFTMEMHMQFVYQEGKKLEFDFRGDDDVWIYVNNILAIDLGGLNFNAKDTLFLDKRKNELKIVDGQVYSMDIFYAERNPVGSNLLIKTSMDLRNSSDLYYKEKVIAPGAIKYDIWEQKQTTANDCGLTRLSDGEDSSVVEFWIEGPQFSAATQLPSGVSYKGISVGSTNTSITIDSAKIDGLLPGDYKITFYSVSNKERSGYLIFTVASIPDHLDLLPDTLLLNLKKDAEIDSITMGDFKDSLLLYAIVRDIYDLYIDDATNLTWKSRDEKVLTISPSKTDKSKAMITKVGEGSTWIVVSQNGLKPDSILIHSEMKVVWPLFTSAVMADSRGDLLPDFLRITLSDTFDVGQTLKSVEISYKNKNYNVKAVSCQVSGNSIIAPFTSLTGIDSKPSGSVVVVLDVNGKEKRDTGTFTDGVGPVLVSAEILEKDGAEPDVLFLTFSESINPATLTGPQLLHVNNSGKDTTVLNVAGVQEKINDSTYSVVLVFTVNPPLPGELLRLVPGSKGGAILELQNNRPHDLNPPVIIKLRNGAATILKTWYKDTNADGVLDQLLVQFKRAIEIAELDTISVEWNQKIYKIESGKLLKVKDSIISIPILGNVVDAKKIETSGSMFVSQKYKNSNVPRTSSVTDSAAPVLVAAKLMFGNYNDDETKEKDTLVATFSEAVQSMGTYPFALKSGTTSVGYQFEVAPPSAKDLQYTFLVHKTDPLAVLPSKGDSIWINEKGSVVGGGIQQINEKNHRTILDIILPPVIWILKVGPNPLKIPGSSFTIKVQTKKGVNLSPYTAVVNICDEVGSTIENTIMVKDDNSFICNWSGHNKNGRLVGAGTYLAIVTVFKYGNKEWSKTRNLGVKR